MHSQSGQDWCRDKDMEKEKQESSIYITLETLKIFKEGHRHTTRQTAVNCAESETSASLGDELNSFPRLRKKEAKTYVQAMKSDLEGRFQEYAKHLGGSRPLYAGNEEEAMEWKKDEQFLLAMRFIWRHYLSCSCHIGPGVSCGSDKNCRYGVKSL